MDLHDFDVLTFDCYGTLIDWEGGIAAQLVPWAERHGLGVSADELLEVFAVAEHRQEAATPGLLYPQILEHVFADISAHFGVAVEAEEARAFGRSVQEWPAFPDSPAALAYLKQHYKLVIISNIDRASFAHSNAKLKVDFDAIITAEEVGSYKPDLRNFEFAFARLAEMGIRREKILHVAQSLFHDHEPAGQLGLRSVWINRRAGQTGWGATAAPRSEVTPDLTFESMAALVEAHRGVSG